MRPSAFSCVLFGVLCACSTLGPRKGPTRRRPPPVAVLRASVTYDSATAEIRIPCTVTNEGGKPLALVYASFLETTQPGWFWHVDVVNDRGVHLEDCSVPIRKLRIPQSSDYTVLPVGQQLAFTFRVKARALVLPSDPDPRGPCRGEQGPVPTGMYTVHVRYEDRLTHHRRAVSRMQIPVPLMLTVK